MDITAKQIIGINRTLDQILPELVGLLGIYSFSDLNQSCQDELIALGIKEGLLDMAELIEDSELAGLLTIYLQGRIGNYQVGKIITKEAKHLVSQELDRMIENHHDLQRGYDYEQDEDRFLFDREEARHINQDNYAFC